MKMLIAVLVAGLFVFGSAADLVLNRHANRKLFVELQDLRKIKQSLDQEWGQLLLEQATWGTQLRVEETAGARLGMISPTSNQIVELR